MCLHDHCLISLRKLQEVGVSVLFITQAALPIAEVHKLWPAGLFSMAWEQTMAHIFV